MCWKLERYVIGIERALERELQELDWVPALPLFNFMKFGKIFLVHVCMYLYFHVTHEFVCIGICVYNNIHVYNNISLGYSVNKIRKHESFGKIFCVCVCVSTCTCIHTFMHVRNTVSLGYSVNKIRWHERFYKLKILVEMCFYFYNNNLLKILTLML